MAGLNNSVLSAELLQTTSHRVEKTVIDGPLGGAVYTMSRTG
jgi:hypothetical protein